MPDIQYIEQAAKGRTVAYGDGSYRIQDDGRGWLHIVVKGKKIGLDKVLFFEYGTEADYVFNEWWKIYKDPKTFASFTASEKSWINPPPQ